MFLNFCWQLIIQSLSLNLWLNSFDRHSFDLASGVGKFYLQNTEQNIRRLLKFNRNWYFQPNEIIQWVFQLIYKFGHQPNETSTKYSNDFFVETHNNTAPLTLFCRMPAHLIQPLQWLRQRISVYAPCYGMSLSFTTITSLVGKSLPAIDS